MKISEQQFVAFDTETTGLWAPSNRLVEIGAVKFCLGGSKTSTFQALINPERPMPAEVIAVHGISDEMVANERKAGEVMPDFLEFCGKDSVLLAHNALFDISFLACELDRNERRRPENLVLDTVTISRKVFPEVQSYSLLSLAQHFGLSQEQQHRALDDAILVQKIFELAVKKLNNISTISELTRKFKPIRIADWQQEKVSLPAKFSGITKALENSLRVEITYAGNGQALSVRVVRPKAIYSLKSKLYINAYCELAGDERTFRLDRIESYRLLG
ncbi:MAG: WYL domain-containing protein [candidate division Zixibacteria bacterium]|nr:WYL domain-containing protein [candidate division Zixibacteria bacterium]